MVFLLSNTKYVNIQGSYRNKGSLYVHTMKNKGFQSLNCFQVLFGLSFLKKYPTEKIWILVEKWVKPIYLVKMEGEIHWTYHECVAESTG